MMDLSRHSEDRRVKVEKVLLARLANVLETPVERLTLASDPDVARHAVRRHSLRLGADYAAEGIVALDKPPGDALSLYQFGSPDFPVCVLVARNTKETALLGETLAPVAACLLDTGLRSFTPGARLAARKDRQERDAILHSIVKSLADVLGETGDVTTRGLIYRRIDVSALAKLGLIFAKDGEELVGYVRDAQTARTLNDYLGFGYSARLATVMRTTRETDITLSLDLDGEGGRIDTGVAFFDHMLEQIARHGGIGLDVICKGDVEVDAHHTIEDVCLALGEGLRKALGDKRGISRFGFELPMDETRAGVWIDLSGRPYAVFEGHIPGDRVGDFPVEMCAHAFRSMAENLKAAVHVKVEGENAHHMIESCFKAFGRALRMAIRVEDQTLPSTKEVL